MFVRNSRSESEEFIEFVECQMEGLWAEGRVGMFSWGGGEGRRGRREVGLGRREMGLEMDRPVFFLFLFFVRKGGEGGVEGPGGMEIHC